MSETYDMYKNNEENSDNQQHKQQTVSLQSLGKLSKITVDGKDVYIIDPSTIEQISKKMEHTYITIDSQNNKINNFLHIIKRLETRIESLEKNMARIFTND